MKKEFAGVFEKVCYNDCEAGCPLGIHIKGKNQDESPDVLCDLVKEAFNLDLDLMEGSPSHALVGKKVKITIEVDE